VDFVRGCIVQSPHDDDKSAEDIDQLIQGWMTSVSKKTLSKKSNKRLLQDIPDEDVYVPRSSTFRSKCLIDPKMNSAVEDFMLKFRAAASVSGMLKHIYLV
jgi:hypothetical protein